MNLSPAENTDVQRTYAVRMRVKMSARVSGWREICFGRPQKRRETVSYF
jgi:hypothetical protein